MQFNSLLEFSFIQVRLYKFGFESTVLCLLWRNFSFSFFFYHLMNWQYFFISSVGLNAFKLSTDAACQNKFSNYFLHFFFSNKYAIIIDEVIKQNFLIQSIKWDFFFIKLFFARPSVYIYVRIGL